MLDNTDDNRLTLTTCHPRFSASQRMVVTATLIGNAVPAPTTAPPGRSTTDDECSAAGDEAGLSAARPPPAARR